MSDPINVLVVIDHLGTGGAQEFIYQLCSRVAPERTRLSVCAFHAGDYQKKIQALGIPVYVLASRRNLFSYLLAVVKLWGMLDSQHYKVVNTVLQGSFAIVTPLARLRNVANVHSIMAVRAQLQRWYFQLLSWYQGWVNLYLTPIPNELTVAGVCADKIKLVEVTVDLTEMLAVQHDVEREIEPFDLRDAYPVALSIGRLHPDKGHEYAIQAWPSILKQWPGARLLIVGDGEDESRLKALAGDHNLANTVIFTGYRRDLASLFARADMFLRTSINEGVNLTTIQAMAAGLPMIGFHNSAPKEIISHDVNGLLVPLGDTNALAKIILQLSGNQAEMKRLGSTARVGVKQYYDMGSVVTFYEQLYEAIASKYALSAIPDMNQEILSFNDHFSKIAGEQYLSDHISHQQ